MNRRHVLTMTPAGLLGASAVAIRSAGTAQAPRDRREHGRPQGTRYSPLAQINRAPAGGADVAFALREGATR